MLISKEDFDEIEAMKLSKLREEVKKGIEASQAIESIEIEQDELDCFIKNDDLRNIKLSANTQGSGCNRSIKSE